MAEDWDNIFLLDACRYDLFADCADIDGILKSRISLGSSSEEFLERNFTSETHHDTVYVNANPYIDKLGLGEGTFHAVVDCLSDWDSQLETIPPEPVAEAARGAREKFPEKRLIVHFMQPHTPFIGETGREIESGGWTMDHTTDSAPGIWNQLRSGEIEPDLAWQAYEENLELVLNVVKPLIAEFEGKSVVTSDHGNLFGERIPTLPTTRRYGHPYGVHTESLMKVPWLVVEDSPRRAVTEDPPLEYHSVSESELDSQLEALGYK